MKPNPFSRVLNKFMSNWDDLSPDLKVEISAQLDRGVAPYEAVSVVFKKHGLREKLKDWIADACIGGAEKGGVTFTSNLVGRNYFLEKSFDKDGLSLSARVTKLKFQDDVASTIHSNLVNQDRFDKLVKEISQYTTKEDLPKGLIELERSARRVIAGNTEEFQEFKKILSREKAAALRALDDGNETALKRSYVRLTKAAEKLDADGLDKAVEYAIDQKAKSAAFRIAHTETARAYGMATKTMAANDEMCTGIEWTLSSAENHCDDCDDLDGEIFPIDGLPEYPAHPHCSCILTPFYGPEDQVSDPDEEPDDSTIPVELLANDED
jgi:SPP1 gp7 family putative phage head morphogenesis protein